MSAADAGLYPEPDGSATGGWSGSATSRERARAEEASGARGRRQQQVHALLREAGPHGLTDPEVQSALVIGHGASSGALTRLHRDGRIARLTERRARNEVYVMPWWVNGRPIAPYRPNRREAAGLREALDILAERLAREEARLARLGPAAAPNVQAHLAGRVTALRSAMSLVATRLASGE